MTFGIDHRQHSKVSETVLLIVVKGAVYRMTNSTSFHPQLQQVKCSEEDAGQCALLLLDLCRVIAPQPKIKKNDSIKREEETNEERVNE